MTELSRVVGVIVAEMDLLFLKESVLRRGKGETMDTISEDLRIIIIFLFSLITRFRILIILFNYLVAKYEILFQ